MHRAGEAQVRKTVRMHLHYALFAEILRDLAKTVSSMPLNDAAQQNTLRDAAKALYLALDARACGSKDDDDTSKMTPGEEVLLLHVLE